MKCGLSGIDNFVQPFNGLGGLFGDGFGEKPRIGSSYPSYFFSINLESDSAIKGQVNSYSLVPYRLQHVL